jgi:hypothetical protein
MLARSSGSPALPRPSNTAGRFGVCSFIHLTVIAGFMRRASAMFRPHGLSPAPTSPTCAGSSRPTRRSCRSWSGSARSIPRSVIPRLCLIGFLLSLQVKSRLEMAEHEPEALKDELWRRREPRLAAPYFKRAVDAKDHAFDRERGAPIPLSWLKSHGRSLEATMINADHSSVAMSSPWPVNRLARKPTSKKTSSSAKTRSRLISASCRTIELCSPRQCSTFKSDMALVIEH